MTTFNPNEMTFIEHLDELRSRIIKSGIIWLAVFIGCFMYVKEYIFPFLAQPLKNISKTAHVFAATDIKEPFFANIKAAFWVSIIFSSGIFFYHLWRFIAPGLTRKERTFAIPFLLFMSIFFILGCVFSFTQVFPYALEYLTNWNDEGLPAYTRSSYLSLLFAFVIGMGASFEIPMVIFLLAKLGLVTPNFLIRHFKYAVLIVFTLAAIITPTPDVYMQTFLALPMLGLYILGIGLAFIVTRGRNKKLLKEENESSDIEPAQPEN